MSFALLSRTELLFVCVCPCLLFYHLTACARLCVTVTSIFPHPLPSKNSKGAKFVLQPAWVMHILAKVYVTYWCSSSWPSLVILLCYRFLPVTRVSSMLLERSPSWPIGLTFPEVLWWVCLATHTHMYLHSTFLKCRDCVQKICLDFVLFWVVFALLHPASKNWQSFFFQTLVASEDHVFHLYVQLFLLFHLFLYLLLFEVCP